jgi:hypothetical protein
LAYKTKRQCQLSDSKLRSIALRENLSQNLKVESDNHNKDVVLEEISVIDESFLVEKLVEPTNIFDDDLIEAPEYLDDHQSLFVILFFVLNNIKQN